jgi:hypothetical protein
MATREKTIIYTFPMTTADVVDAVVTNLTQMTIEIPETVISFTSVFADVGFQDIVTATGGTIGEHRVGLRLGAAGYTTFTELDDIPNTGENIGGIIGPIDFTSHFTTNWTGTSMTCDLQVYFDQTTGTTLGMRNVTAQLFITYTYNDDPTVNPTQIKTVRIPMESLTGALSTTVNSQIGTNQIPQLTGTGGFLPENTVSIVDYAFVVENNEHNNNTTTDFTISCSIDSGTATNFGVQEAALGSDRYLRWVYKPAVPTTTAAHSFHMWSSVASKMQAICVELTITYKFNASATTRVLNSICIPLEMDSPIGNTTAADKSRITRDIIVSDKGTITLRQSAVRLHWNANAGLTVGVNIGSQAARSYVLTATTVCGGFSLQQRIDSGSGQGAGITLARGRNSFILDVFGNSASVLMTNVSGYIILNYESDKETLPGANTHTMYKLFDAWDAALRSYTSYSARGIAIPESNYWLASLGFMSYFWVSSAALAISFDAEYASTEGPGAGWEKIYSDTFIGDTEIGFSRVFFRARDAFRRCPQDTVSGRMDIETSRQWRMYNSTTAHRGLISIHSTHAITHLVEGTITGLNAALPTTLRLVDNTTREVMQEQVAAAGVSTFSFTVYNNVIEHYVDAYQDDTHVGRSALAPAV